MTPRAAASSVPTFRPPKTSKQKLLLFERPWSNFPLGGLPLDLLTHVSRRLVAFFTFLRSLDLPTLSPASRSERRYEATYFGAWSRLDHLQIASYRDLEGIVFKELSTLLVLLVLAPPRRANPSLHRRALFDTMRRLGQVYQICKQRWTAREARAMVLEQMERVCQAWLRGQMLLLLAAPLRPPATGEASTQQRKAPRRTTR